MAQTMTEADARKEQKRRDRERLDRALADLGAAGKKWPRLAVAVGLALGETFRKHGWSEARIASLTDLGMRDYVLAVGTVRRHFELYADDTPAIGREDARAVDEFAAWLARRFPGVPAGTILEEVTAHFEQIDRAAG